METNKNQTSEEKSQSSFRFNVFFSFFLHFILLYFAVKTIIYVGGNQSARWKPKVRKSERLTEDVWLINLGGK